MGKPYSMDLRERVVAAIEGGVSTRLRQPGHGRGCGRLCDACRACDRLRDFVRIGLPASRENHPSNPTPAAIPNPDGATAGGRVCGSAATTTASRYNQVQLYR